MSDWLISIEGTDAGRTVALWLALIAALLHAAFGALQKGRHDPWLSRGVIDVCYGLMAAPVALFVVPWPEPHMWPIFAGMILIHVGYKFLQVMAYDRAPYTVVYPVMRGMGPLVTVLAAGFVFSETFSTIQWLGVLTLSAGIFALGGVNLRAEALHRRRLSHALLLALATGVFVAIYTTYDAYGIRATHDPFTFIAWFFFLDGLVFPFVTLRHYLRLEHKPALPGLALRGMAGGLIGVGSFGSIMMATRLDKVGEAAVLRETSVIFAAIIGWLFLREKVGVLRAALMVVIGGGAVLVEFGG
ncbi:MAG: EamA family transporter [Rhodobacteraceae bacterium]|nr:EamA family transporter [Paracoccaceae bacterium]